MSRCFPYPPPGYLKNGVRDSAVIESIKLSREEEKARKHEKKDKKREKREKQKAMEGGEIESKKPSHKKRHRDERSQDRKADNHQKGLESEVESKSSITEEHGPAVGSQNSSDSTLNSNKRLKESSSFDGRHNTGNKIRIRMPTPRHTDPEVLPIKEQQPSSASERISDAATGQGIAKTASRSGIEPGEKNPCSTSKSTVPRITLKLGTETPRQTERVPSKAEGSLTSKLCRTCPPALVLQLKNLVEEWIPPPMESNGFEDEEWLFQTTKDLKPSSKEVKYTNLGLSRENVIQVPRACYLPEVNLYALPFTIPF